MTGKVKRKVKPTAKEKVQGAAKRKVKSTAKEKAKAATRLQNQAQKNRTALSH
jgi:hypothetical protein